MNEDYPIGVIESIARGVCVKDGKVLLCKAKGGTSTYLPGGHIEFGETGRVALEREIEEELGVSSRAGAFITAVENSFMQKGQRHCEINLVYRMEIELETSSAKSCEDWIEFVWQPIEKLDEANLLPEAMKELVRA